MLVSDEDFRKLPKMFPIITGTGKYVDFSAISYCGMCGSHDYEMRGLPNDASLSGHEIYFAKGLARCGACKNATEVSFRIDFTSELAKMRVGDGCWHLITMNDHRKPSWKARLKNFATKLFFGKKSH